MLNSHQKFLFEIYLFQSSWQESVTNSETTKLEFSSQSLMFILTLSVIFNRELVSAVLRVDLLLGICQQVFLLEIWFKRVHKAHRGIPKCPKVSQSIAKYPKVSQIIPKYPKVESLVIRDIIYTINIRDITSNSNKSSNGNISTIDN